MITLIRNIILLPWKFKGKILVFLALTLVFLFLLFPLNDLSDFVANATRNATNNAVSIEFSDLHLSFSPLPGLEFSQVLAEVGAFSPLISEQLGIYPSLAAVISQAPYGKIKAEGLFKGNLNINVKKGSRTEAGDSRMAVTIQGEELSLEEIRQWARLPMNLRGTLEIDSSITADPTMKEQPDAEMNFQVMKFELPPFPLVTDLGAFTLPELKFSSVELKGRLSDGKFIIESGKLGKESDDLFGTIKGNLGMNIVGGPGGVAPQIGAYTVDLDLKMKKVVENRLSLFLTLISQFKTEAGALSQYKFRVSALSLRDNPKFTSSR